MATPSVSAESEQAVAVQLRQLIMGFRTTQLIAVAATLGLADQLRDQPQSAPALALAVSAQPQALQRLLRALASIGLVTETDTGAFALTPLGRPLVRDLPGSLHSVARLYGEDWLWSAYGQLLHSVQTGRPAFDHVHGQSFYDYLAQHADAAALFNAAMSGYSGHEQAALLAAYDWSGLHTVVDVGGGQGGLLAALLAGHPSMHGVLFEQPAVAAEAAQWMHQAGLGERCRCVAGDFFAAVTAGGDAYVLKSVLHNWNDAESTAILRNCRAAMAEGGRVLVVERVIPPGNEPAEAKLFDVNMLVVLGGRERTEAEYRHVLAAAGLRMTQIIATSSPLSIVEARTA